jgi:hypothetical protein
MEYRYYRYKYENISPSRTHCCLYQDPLSMRFKAPGIDIEFTSGELYFTLVFIWTYLLLSPYIEALLARAQCRHLELIVEPSN